MYSLASFIDMATTVLGQALLVKNQAVVSKSSSHVIDVWVKRSNNISWFCCAHLGGVAGRQLNTLCVMDSSILVFRVYSESDHFPISFAATLVPENAHTHLASILDYCNNLLTGCSLSPFISLDSEPRNQGELLKCKSGHLTPPSHSESTPQPLHDSPSSFS